MLNLLIIDDEKYIRKILNEILSKEGYVIDEAVDGDEGWNKFYINTYDAVLCDIKMPKMNGIELIKNVFEIKSDILQDLNCTCWRTCYREGKRLSMPFRQG